jgi:glycine hydroxymethyltransferase
VRYVFSSKEGAFCALNNKHPENAVSGDASAQVPGGIRIGTAALTSRNMREDDLRKVADFLHRAVQLSLLAQKESGSKLLKDFVRAATVPQEGKTAPQQVVELRREVRAFARQWPVPGITGPIVRPAGIEEDD